MPAILSWNVCFFLSQMAHMATKALQFYLTVEQHAALREAARRTGRAMTNVIRLGPARDRALRLLG